jgi:cytochrome c oxidase cbb3-type subunit 3
MAWRTLLVVAVIMAMLAGIVIVRQENSGRTTPMGAGAHGERTSIPNLYPGGSPPEAMTGAARGMPGGISAFDVSEGKRLFQWFNCSTCHANGGGGIGPALMDEKWLYGANSQDIMASIVEGRPNGMPSFRGRIPDKQLWQIVAYIRAMSGHVPVYMKPGRNDDISAKTPESRTPSQPVEPGQEPPQDSKAGAP